MMNQRQPAVSYLAELKAHFAQELGETIIIARKDRVPAHDAITLIPMEFSIEDAGTNYDYVAEDWLLESATRYARDEQDATLALYSFRDRALDAIRELGLQVVAASTYGRFIYADSGNRETSCQFTFTTKRRVPKIGMG